MNIDKSPDNFFVAGGESGRSANLSQRRKKEKSVRQWRSRASYFFLKSQSMRMIQQLRIPGEQQSPIDLRLIEL